MSTVTFTDIFGNSTQVKLEECNHRNRGAPDIEFILVKSGYDKTLHLH